MISSEQRPSHIRTGGQFENVFLGPRPVFQKLREDVSALRQAASIGGIPTSVRVFLRWSGSEGMKSSTFSNKVTVQRKFDESLRIPPDNRRSAQ